MECYYFGTFNPVHIGHIKTADDCIKKLGYSKVIFVPCAVPCHKEAKISADDRFNMLKLIETDKIKVSDIEFKLPKPSYSYNTVLELLKTKKKGEKINFIIGFDAFKNIEHWKNPEVLKENVHFIVLKRSGENREEIEKLYDRGWDFQITDNIDTIDISSTEIRNRAKEGLPIGEFVQQEVGKYIDENGLYRRD